MKLGRPFTKNLNKYTFTIFPAVVVLATGVGIYSIQFSIFPDFFDLKHYSKTYELFNLIISSLTSLIGIYITVSLVAYEFFKQKSGIDFQKSFLINKTNAIFISFSVSTIIVVFVSSLVIDLQTPNYNEVSIIYYNSILFFLVLFLLFPVAFNLFSSLNPGKLASEELEKIDYRTIFIIHEKDASIDAQVERIEDDHLNKIQNIVIALISVSDKIKAQAIIVKCATKIGGLIIDSKNVEEQKYISERLVNFYINVIDYTLLQPNNSGMLNSIWHSVESIYGLLITEKKYAYNLADFRGNLFERYFNRLIENNKEEVIFIGIETIRDIIYNQMVSNMPPDEELYNVDSLRSQVEEDFSYPVEYAEDAHEKSRHWSEIAIEFYSYFSLLMQKAIKHNQPELLNKCFDTLNELNADIERKDYLGKYKQCLLYLRSSRMITDYAYSAFKENLFTTGSDTSGLLPTLLEEDIRKEKLYSFSVLQKYCYLLLRLQELEKLDRWFLGGLDFGGLIWEGDLGQIARRCVFNLKENPNVEKCLRDIIDTYSILKENFEKSNNKRFDLYSAVKDRLVTISELINKHQKEYEELRSYADNIIDDFKTIEEFEKRN
ncbi:hypothetical protein [Myroides odoratus]|uniref:hypothetical protein n=1 Tax=Myroides odoratus TaxID=256 RepID=UPI0039AEC1A8